VRGNAKHSLGAGVNLQPNAVRALIELGLADALRANLFPGQGAAATSGASGTRQIIGRQGPERVCHEGVGTFAGQSHASFGQLLVILGDQHCF
jgi:hypothetical protein